MIEQTDLEINRQIRRVLVKHWVDLGRVSVRTSRGRIMIFGILNRIEGHREPLTGPGVDSMIYEMRRVQGVVQLRAHFENWANEGGRWRPIERPNQNKEDAATETTPNAATPGPAVGGNAG